MLSFLWGGLQQFLTLILLSLIDMILSFTPVQTPSDLLRFPGNSISVNCSHQYGNMFNKMFWYRQRATHDLHLLGVLTYEQSVLNNLHYNVSGDARREGYLEVAALSHEYSAVYFCALNDGAQCHRLFQCLYQNITPWSCDLPAPVIYDFSTTLPSHSDKLLVETCFFSLCDNVAIYFQRHFLCTLVYR